MKNIFIVLLSVVLLALAGCRGNKTETCPHSKKGGSAEDKACRMKCAEKASQTDGFSGVVVQHMDAKDYTYVQVDTGTSKVWAVAPRFQINSGDTVSIHEPMPMKNYSSKTLNRTFDLVYFAGSITKGQEPLQAESPHHMNGSEPVQLDKSVDFSGIKKPLQGKTIAEIYSEMNSLAGKNVILRAKVVKATYGVLGKTWLHVQDGTGATGENDLTVTTDATVKVGETVLVDGRLTKDKDVGAGYKYRLIVENAKVTVEK